MRLTKWEGRDEDGPRAVLIQREGPFAKILQPALRKLARFEDEEERATTPQSPLATAPLTQGSLQGENE